jgi:D-lyxose ketol-isomerase
MPRTSPWARVILVSPRPREAPHGHDFARNVMHVETDEICPRCLRWIAAADIVRRTAYGLVQHESCTSKAPTPRERAARGQY